MRSRYFIACRTTMNDQYSELYTSYRWYVPTQFNIADAAVLRWAINPFEGRRPSIVAEDEFGDQTHWSFNQLTDTLRKLGNGLLRMGLNKGDRVAIAMNPCPEFVAACMAVLACGGVVVPLPSVLTAQQVTARLANAQATIAIVDMANAPGVIQAYGHHAGLRQIISFGFQHELTLAWNSLLARQNAEFRPIMTSAGDPAFIFYPAGNAVAPLGTVVNHRALIGALPGFVASQNWFPKGSEVFWTQHSWAHPEGLLNGLLPCLYFGRPILALSGHRSVASTIEALETYKVSHITVPCVSLRAVMEEAPELDRTRLALKGIATTGEPPCPEVNDWVLDTLGLTPNPVFGQPEAPVIIGHSHERWPIKPGSMGRAYPGHWVTLLDDNGKVCPAGQTGQIAVNRFDLQGHPDPALFAGYWLDAAATQQRMHGNWYLTGELAKLDRDGYFWYVGHTASAGPENALSAPGHDAKSVSI